MPDQAYTPPVALLISTNQDDQINLAVVDRLLENHLDFTGFAENRLPEEFSEELLKSRLLLLDSGSVEKLTATQLDLLENYARENYIYVFDRYEHNHRGGINIEAELFINTAIASAGLFGDWVQMRSQNPETVIGLIEQRCRKALRGNLSFTEFTLHNLRALEAIENSRFNSGEGGVLAKVLTELYSGQDIDRLPPSYEPLSVWCYARRHYELTGDRRFADAMLKVVDDILERRPRTTEGIIAGAGFADDPIGRRSGKLLIEAYTNLRRAPVYNDLLHFHGPLFAVAAMYSGDHRYLDHAMRLVRHIGSTHFDPKDNLLFYHSLDGKPFPAKWGRGLAHALWGLDQILRLCPDLPPEYRDEIVGLIDRIGDGLPANQLECGLWRTILDMPDSAEESSSAICFVTVYGRLVNLGMLSKEKYIKMIEKATAALLKMSWRGGIGGNCAWTFIANSRDFFVRRWQNYCFQAQLALALIEADKLSK